MVTLLHSASCLLSVILFIKPDLEYIPTLLMQSVRALSHTKTLKHYNVIQHGKIVHLIYAYVQYSIYN